MSNDGPIYRMTRGAAFVIHSDGIDARWRGEENPEDCWEDNGIRVACNARRENEKEANEDNRT